MTAKNDVTGDPIKSRHASNLYRDNYDRIFGKKEKKDGREEQHERPVQPTDGR